MDHEDNFYKYQPEAILKRKKRGFSFQFKWIILARPGNHFNLNLKQRLNISSKSQNETDDEPENKLWKLNVAIVPIIIGVTEIV